MIEINGRLVGPGEPCFVVAEIGVNHGGNISQAMRLIDAAKGCGANACKFQSWRTSRLVKPDHPFYRTLLPLELSEGQFRALKNHADQVGITFLSTPDQEEDADFLDELVPAFKIGSGNARNLPFLKHVARKKRPILLSTGMCDLKAVEEAVSAIVGEGNDQLILLHCLSVYPTANDRGRAPDPAGQNLRAIRTMAEEFGYPVGLSDHSRCLAAAVAAVALGAVVYEAHLRLDDMRDGPDAGVSLAPDAFGWVVRSIRWTEAALGDGVKLVAEAEEATMKGIEGWRLRP